MAMSMVEVGLWEGCLNVSDDSEDGPVDHKCLREKNLKTSETCGKYAHKSCTRYKHVAFPQSMVVCPANEISHHRLYRPWKYMVGLFHVHVHV